MGLFLVRLAGRGVLLWFGAVPLCYRHFLWIAASAGDVFRGCT